MDLSYLVYFGCCRGRGIIPIEPFFLSYTDGPHITPTNRSANGGTIRSWYFFSLLEKRRQRMRGSCNDHGFTRDTIYMLIRAYPSTYRKFLFICSTIYCISSMCKRRRLLRPMRRESHRNTFRLIGCEGTTRIYLTDYITATCVRLLSQTRCIPVGSIRASTGSRPITAQSRLLLWHVTHNIWHGFD